MIASGVRIRVGELFDPSEIFLHQFEEWDRDDGTVEREGIELLDSGLFSGREA